MSKGRIAPRRTRQQGAPKAKPGTPPALPTELPVIKETASQEEIAAQAYAVAESANRLAYAVKSFASEQWRFYTDIYAAMREASEFDATFDRLLKAAEAKRNLQDRKTVLHAASWYLHEHCDELWERGTELRTILQYADVVLPGVEKRKKKGAAA